MPLNAHHHPPLSCLLIRLALTLQVICGDNGRLPTNLLDIYKGLYVEWERGGLDEEGGPNVAEEHDRPAQP